MLIAQVVLCIIAGIIAGVWSRMNASEMFYLATDKLSSAKKAAPMVGFLAFFTWFINLSQMVPISLIVSAEMVKFIQSVFIESDMHMYYGKINKPTKCNSSTIHEDLGLVDYIFSDKTGTLTQNKMTFRYCLMEGHEYGSQETEIARAVKARSAALEARKRAGTTLQPDESKDNTLSWTALSAPYHTRPDGEQVQDCCDRNCGCFLNTCLYDAGAKDGDEDVSAPKATEFTTQERQQFLESIWKDTKEENKAHRELLKTFVEHMALSNTVKPYFKSDEKSADNKEGKFTFSM
jgi:magnesium-transporting ATPase (P-type)